MDDAGIGAGRSLLPRWLRPLSGRALAERVLICSVFGAIAIRQGWVIVTILLGATIALFAMELVVRSIRRRRSNHLASRSSATHARSGASD